MPETPQPPESFRDKLTQRVTEIRNEAVNAWAGMNIKDYSKTIAAGMGLAVIGIMIATAAGHDPVLVAIKALGGVYVASGAAGMVAGVVKSLELESAGR